MRPVAADNALGRADAGAIDQHPGWPMRRGGFADRRAGGRFIRHVADEGDAAHRFRRLLRRGGVEIEHRDFRALGGERLRRRTAEPGAPARDDRRNFGKFHRVSSPARSELISEPCRDQPSLTNSLPPSTFTG